MNQLQAIGNLGKDAELKQSQSGYTYARFSLAVKTGKDKTMWLACTIWGKQAETLTPYLTKGKQVAVSGSFQESEYEKDGAIVKYIDVNVQNVTLCDGNKQEQQPKQQTQQAKQQTQQSSVNDQDIPF